MKKRKTVKKRYVIALVIVIAGLITLWRILNAPVPTYQTLIVRPGDLQQSVLATGKLDALRKVDVGAQVSGQLKTLSVAIPVSNVWHKRRRFHSRISTPPRRRWL